MYFLLNIQRQGVVKPRKFSSSNKYLSKIKNLSKDTCRTLISKERISLRTKWSQVEVLLQHGVSAAPWNIDLTLICL